MSEQRNVPFEVGRYTVHAEVAAGGMARVHLATVAGPFGFRKVVAVKRLHAELAREPDVRELFLDEGRLSARISHANVVPMLDVVDARREVLLVMEYIDGEALHRLIAAARLQREPIPIPVCVAIATGVLRGLHAAHETKNEHGESLGVVHRDVSPSNVLVGSDGIARTLDFGIARAAGQNHVTRDGVVRGKIAYVSPEQLHGLAVTRQSDVYSMSVVLWEMLTLERLFGGEGDAVTAARVASFMAPPPSRHRPDVPRTLNRIVMRGLARQRQNRYGTGAEMADELEACVPPASPQQVAAWMEKLAASALAERRAMVASCSLAATTRKPPSRRAARLAFSLGAAGVIALLAAWAWSPRAGKAALATEVALTTTAATLASTPVFSPPVMTAPVSTEEPPTKPSPAARTPARTAEKVSPAVTATPPSPVHAPVEDDEAWLRARR
ncbi:serine/threonine protein kinase [Labilithrix luteola]|uniref:Serine/threonine protein kinase n=1 Tax=Labilithrix luteola TaxID=1391654 RepID=A0A0K1Q171_9BACT|nr:protein kinase [Labilithrix luteola]AKU99487.1 serine/threonine protein kinase [Labilithrix luteola]